MHVGYITTCDECGDTMDSIDEMLDVQLPVKTVSVYGINIV